MSQPICPFKSGGSARFEISSSTACAARRPAKELKGLARVHLEAGEEKQVTIPVRLADLDYFQTDANNPATGNWVVETGAVKVMVGSSSADLPLSALVPVTGY
jgi:beta-glucosidase